jgi:hypothetical protein
LVGRLLNVDQHEADLYGLYAPKKSEVMAAVVGQAISDEELARGWDRLLAEEQETFMRLLAKLQGRLVEEPPAIEEGSVETTAATAAEKATAVKMRALGYPNLVKARGALKRKPKAEARRRGTLSPKEKR